MNGFGSNTPQSAIDNWGEQPDRPRPRPKPLMTEDFFAALVAAGVLPADQRVRRVVIDAQFGPRVVKVHVEMLGDVRLLTVASTLAGVRISREEPSG